MRDDVNFETRLSDALERYAELAPTLDDAAIAGQAIAATRSVGRIRWPEWLRQGGSGWGRVGPTQPRIAYLLMALALLLAAILLAVAAGSIRNDPLRPQARNGVIAFSVQGNNHEPAVTQVMNPDGTGDQAVAAGRCPTYSKNGSVRAALTYQGATYLMVQGAAEQPARKILLVDAPSTAVSYALSPDGTRVAWFKPVQAGTVESPPASRGGPAPIRDSVELWVAPIVGGRGTRILSGSNVSGKFDSSPLWSPDGGHIAFGTYVRDATTGERHRSAVSVVTATGSDLHVLTTRPGLFGDGMAWSPDGRFIAYIGLPDRPPTPASAQINPPAGIPPRDLFLIGADGRGERNLTSTPASESQPEWSPDGAFLAFETAADPAPQRLTIIHMNGPTPIGPALFGPESAWFVWSPDGMVLLWLEVSSLGSEAFRSTFQSIDRDFRQAPVTLKAVDGLVVCTPTWQRLEP